MSGTVCWRFFNLDYKICLGTVQFGMHYGINNALGRQPNADESFNLLQTAIDNGIKFFDTASVYGNAENLLGEFKIKRFNVNVISKLRPNLPADHQLVFNEIQSSLNRLNLKSLNGYLLHHADDFYRQEILRGLKLAKEKGLTQNIGVSIYEPDDALNAVRDPDVDYIQIPYNVLDQRLDQTDFFELAHKNKVTVFARSAFLQGLLLMEKNNLPLNLSDAWTYIEQFHHIARKYGFEPAEAALLYSYCHPGIDYVLFGVETVEQLKNNLAVLDKAKQFQPCYEELHGKFHSVDRKIIVPSLWKKASNKK